MPLKWLYLYACNGHNAHGLMYFRKLHSRLIERGDDSEIDSYMSLSAEKQSLQNNSLNKSKKERKKTTRRVLISKFFCLRLFKPQFLGLRPHLNNISLENCFFLIIYFCFQK